MISDLIKQNIRDIEDFPKPGIVFKDITPILKDAALCKEIINSFEEHLANIRIDVIAGIESRGFLFGLMLAARLQVPFIPVRKQGKLPFKTIKERCELEYGSAVLELHADAVTAGQHVFIHDDLLATGGTVSAACRLVKQLGGTIAGCCFVISLDFLSGKEKLQTFSNNIVSLASF